MQCKISSREKGLCYSKYNSQQDGCNRCGNGNLGKGCKQYYCKKIIGKKSETSSCINTFGFAGFRQRVNQHSRAPVVLRLGLPQTNPGQPGYFRVQKWNNCEGLDIYSLLARCLDVSLIHNNKGR